MSYLIIPLHGFSTNLSLLSNLLPCFPIVEVLNVLEKTHNVPRKEALKRAFGGPDITDPIRLVPENIKRLEAELDLSPDCVDALRSTLHGAPPEGSVKSVIGNMHVKIFSPKGNQKGNKKR